MDNESLYDEAMEAINKLFGDLSVPKETAIQNMNTLIGEIQVLIESLECDM